VAAGEKRIGSPGSEPVELSSPGSDPRDFAGSPGADPGESEQLREASGTAKGIEDPAAPLPAPAGVGDAPPAPASKQAVEPGRAPIHLVVTSEDPAMKREILALAARWGEATTPAGERIVDGRMSGSAETVAFTVPQADLTELTLQLKKYGYEVSVKSYADSLVGTTVDVLLTLRLVEGTGAAPEAPAELLLDEE
jgi:hypothetical protein